MAAQAVGPAGGWRVLTRVALPGDGPNALVLVALHPRHGIALVDQLPNLTPDAEHRLLLRLQQAGFASVYGAEVPPVLHLALHRHELNTLGETLADAFRSRTWPGLPGGDAWVDTVARMVAERGPRMPVAPEPLPVRRSGVKPALVLVGGVLFCLGGAGLLGWALQEPEMDLPQRAASRAEPPPFPKPPRLPALPLPDPLAGAGEVSPPQPQLALVPPPPVVPPLPAVAMPAPAEPEPLPPEPALAVPVEPAPMQPVPAPERLAAIRPPAPVAHAASEQERRCRAVVLRIQLGEQASEDELRQLQACR